MAKKLKKYKVFWEEKLYIIIEAKSEEEAEELVREGEFSESPISDEITSQPEAYEI